MIDYPYAILKIQGENLSPPLLGIALPIGLIGNGRITCQEHSKRALSLPAAHKGPQQQGQYQNIFHKLQFDFQKYGHKSPCRGSHWYSPPKTFSSISAADSYRLS